MGLCSVFSSHLRLGFFFFFFLFFFSFFFPSDLNRISNIQGPWSIYSVFCIHSFFFYVEDPRGRQTLSEVVKPPLQRSLPTMWSCCTPFFLDQESLTVVKDSKLMAPAGPFLRLLSLNFAMLPS